MLMPVKRWLANRVAGFFDRRGYVITRPRFHEENSLDLRAMLAEPIQKEKGHLNVLQIGANDGIVNDPIRHLVVARGWHLWAVEPMPDPFERLVTNYRDYPNVRCVNCAVGLRDGDARIYSLRAKPGETVDDQYSSFYLDAVRQHWRRIPDSWSRIEEHKVRCLSFPSLLSECRIDSLDMLQLDTEGFDYEIIKMAFAANVLPSILAFEFVNLSKADMWSCRCDLIKHGYEWLLVKGDVVALRTQRSPSA